ncbi:MAG: hypothetical protein QM775_10335 [Pirellulales bacterium]
MAVFSGVKSLETARDFEILGNMSHHAPWEETESVVDALERWGLLDAFNIVLAADQAEEAALLLERVGVDRERAERIVAGVLGPGR